MIIEILFILLTDWLLMESTCASNGVNTEVRGQLVGVSIHHVSPWDGAWVVKFGEEYFDPLHHLAYHF